MTRRTERLADLLRGEIAALLSRAARDPRIAGVTLTRVDVAPDLSEAWVSWSVLEVNPENRLAVQGGLESAAPFLRGRLARSLHLKRVPRLRFRFDPSLEQGSATLALLRELDVERPE